MKIRIILLLVLVISEIPVIIHSEKTCGSGFQLIGRDLCYKQYLSKTTWYDARKRCELDGSYLYGTNEEPLSKREMQKLFSEPNDMVQVSASVWLSMQRLNGYIQTEGLLPQIYNKSNIESREKTKQLRWDFSEPTIWNGCVAMNVKDLWWNTVSCTQSTLPFVCVRRPIVNQLQKVLTCDAQNGWLGHFLLPNLCFRPSEEALIWEEAKDACQKMGATLASNEDFKQFNQNEIKYSLDATKLWAAGRKSSVCSSSSTVWYDCESEKLKFVCKKEGQMPDIKVHLRVKRRQTTTNGIERKMLAKGTSAVWQTTTGRAGFDDLLCEVEVDGRVVNANISYFWKNTGVYNTMKESLIIPKHWTRKSLRIEGTNDNVLGTYECEVNLPHLQTRYKSNKVTIYLEGIRMFLYKIVTTLDKVSDLSNLEETAMSAINWKQLKDSIDYIMSRLFPTDDVKDKYWFVIKLEPYDLNATIKSFKDSPRVSVDVAVGISFYKSKTSSEILAILRSIAEDAEESDIKAEIQITDECPEDNRELRGLNGSLQTYQFKLSYGSTESQPICYQPNTGEMLRRRCLLDISSAAKWEDIDKDKCLASLNAFHGPSKCPEGFAEQQDGSCILLHPSEDTWISAYQTCLQHRAFLPTNKSRETIAQLLNTLETWTQIHRQDDVFLSDGKDVKIENTFFPEDCVTLKEKILSSSSCSEKKPYVCVTEPIPSLLWNAPWCRPGWYGFAGAVHPHCYYFHRHQDASYDRARRECASSNAKLATIDSKEINDAITNTLKELSISDTRLHNVFFWVGLRVNSSGTVWEEGHPARTVSFHNWLPLQSKGSFRKSGAVGIHGFSSEATSSIGKWIIVSTDLMLSFICESTSIQKYRRASAAVSITQRYEDGVFRANLTCDARNTIPSMPVIWYRNGKPLSQEETTLNSSIISSHASSNLSFEVKANKQGDYWCEVWNWEPFQRVRSNRVRVTLPNVNNYILHMTSSTDQEEFLSRFRSYFQELLKQQTFSSFRTGNIQWTQKGHQRSINVHLYQSSDVNDPRENLRDLVSLRDKFLSKFQSVKEKLQIDSIDFRSTVGCPSISDSTSDTTWPMTFVGCIAMSDNMCIANSQAGGEPVIRRCEGDFLQGAFWGPVQGKCDRKPTEVTKSLQKLAKSNITEISMKESASDLQNLTEESKKLDSIDVAYIASILEKMSEAVRNTTDQEVLQHVTDTVDNVLQMDVEKLSSSQEKLNSSNRITSALESIVSSVNLTAQSRNITISTPSLIVDTRLVMPSEEPVVGIASLAEQSHEKTNLVSLKANDKISKINKTNIDAAIILPKSFIDEKLQSQGGEGLRMSFIVYRKGHLFNNTEYLNNSVISATAGPVICGLIDGPPVKNVDPPIKLIFKLNKAVTYKDHIQCVFWDYALNEGVGGWSGDGCWKTSTQDHTVECNCSHLTNFAVIMDFDRIPIDIHHKLALEIITYIGCAISILGLGLTILTYCIFRKWKKKPGRKILCNLSIALLLSIIVFLAGTEQTENTEICMAIAVLLHYCLLASFCWMLIEAVEQYLLFVKVLDAYIPRFMLKAKIFAWGLPFIIVLIVVAVDVNLYDSGGQYCWLSREGLYYAFLLPVGVIISINFTVFILVMKGIVCDRQSILRTNQSKYQTAKMQLQVGLCILLILGLTWIFGFLVISDARTVFQYIFCILNSTQGFLIFIFMVVRDRTAKELWYVFCCKNSGRQCHPTLHELRSQKGENSSENFSRLIGSRYSSTDRWK